MKRYLKNFQVYQKLYEIKICNINNDKNFILDQNKILGFDTKAEKTIS